MKKQKLLKTLLVAAGLFTGVSAWGQTTTTLMEYGTSDVAWTAEGLATWTVPTNEDYLVSGFDDAGSPTYFSISTKATYNAGYEVSKTISPTANSIINVSAIWRGRSNTGRYFSNSNGNYFRFGNIVVAQNDQDKKHGYVFTGLDNLSSVTQFSAGSYRVDITSSTWLKIEAEINTATNTMTSFTIKSEDGATTYVTQTNIVLSTPDYATVALGYKKGSSVTTSPNGVQLKSIKITQTTQAVKVANYTIKFQDAGGNELKSDITDRSGVVGETAAPTSEDKADFYTGTSGDKANYHKWTYNSDNASAIAEDGSTVVIVKFDEVAKYDFSVTSKAGETVLPYTYSGWQFNGETVQAPYPHFQFVGGTLYSKGVTNKEYNQYFTLTSDNQAEEITGYTDSGITGVVFYTEGENVEGTTKAAPNASSTRSSCSAVGTSTGALTLYKDLPAGKYQVTVGFYKPGGSNVSTNFSFGANNVQVATSTSATNLVEVTSDEFVVASTADFIWDGTSYLDYVYVRRTGDLPTNESLTVTAAGMATYVSAYDLDFSASSIKAYKAKVTDKGECTLTAINEVPAGTPVLLVKDGGATEAIPVMTGAAAVSDNDLVAGTGAAVATNVTIEEVDYTNMILNNIGGQVGFYFAAGQPVAANRAYLHFASTLAPDAVGSGSRMTMVFGDDMTTGINAVESAKTIDGIYNLAGQRVAQPTKGLYIMNGKKFVVK